MGFHALKEVSSILAAQKANIVFYKRIPYRGVVLGNEVGRGQYAYGFRRGTMPVSIPGDFTIFLLDKGLGNKEILFSSYSGNVGLSPLESADEYFYNMGEAFRREGLSVTQKFVKGLLISAYGTIGELRVIAPQYGMENISNFLLRNSDFIDCRVFNPNLGGLGRLRHILATESFDFVGLSPLVLEKDLAVMKMVKECGSSALTVAGGQIFECMHPNIFLSSFPVDAAAIGEGENTLYEIARKIHSGQSPVLEAISGQMNVWTFKDGEILPPVQQLKTRHITHDPRQEDVPLNERDIYHNSTYADASRNMGLVLGDIIGQKPIVVMTSDHCRGRCIFCDVLRNHDKSGPKQLLSVVDRVIAEIKGKYSTGEYDAVQVLDNNFTTHKGVVRYFCEQIIEHDLSGIPKSIKARSDDLCVDPKAADPDLELIALLKNAGIKRVYIGIESFNQQALDDMKKDISVAQNEAVLNALQNAGIIPGINIITFGGLNDSPVDVHNTVKKTTEFIERGATLNATDFMQTSENSRIMARMPQRVLYDKLDAPGMRAPLQYASRVFTNPEHYDFAEKAVRMRESFLDVLRYQYPFQVFSPHINSLALFWSVAALCSDMALAEKIEWLIDRDICSEVKSIAPYKKIDNPTIDIIRLALVNRDYEKAFGLYNSFISDIFDSRPAEFSRLGFCKAEQLHIKPDRQVIDMKSLSDHVTGIIQWIEEKTGSPAKIRLAGHPATGKTVLRKALIASGFEFEHVHMDKFRRLRNKSAALAAQEKLSDQYDSAEMFKTLSILPEDNRLLFEGTWILDPEFNPAHINWDISIAFSFPESEYLPFFIFRQLVIRRKNFESIILSGPNLAQKRAMIKGAVDDQLHNADLVIGPNGEIISAKGYAAQWLVLKNITSFDISAHLGR